MKLREFGYGSRNLEHGSLALHVGWIEALANDEEENLPPSGRGPKQKRYEKVQAALQLLHEALENSSDY